jgi:uncharacterized protein (TIGR02145 family)
MQRMKILLLVGSMSLILHSFCSRNTVTDADGNIYPTVRIGGQIWTVDNLRTTKWNDGVPIPQVPDGIAWHSLATPGFCYYRNTNNADSIRKFGALYNWYCVDSKKLAPRGWHVPTNDDWTTLQNYLIEHGYNWDRKRSENNIAKSLAARSGWKPFTIEGTPGNNMKDNNRSGFSGLAAGCRYDTRDSVQVQGSSWKGAFKAIGHKGAWWSATEVNESFGYVYGLGFCVERLIQYDMFFKTCGYSVKLVKNGK